MELDDYLKSKVRYHLGFNAGAQIPAGDRARVEEAMALVPDELWYNEIVYHIKRCDIAWKASAAIPDDYFEPGGSRMKYVAMRLNVLALNLLWPYLALQIQQ